MERGQSVPFGGFRRRTYRLAEAGQDLVWILRHWRRAMQIWMGRRIDPAIREAVMHAVADVNGCRYCAYVHREWAVQAGLDSALLEHRELPTESRLGMSCDYAQALVQARFEAVPGDLPSVVSASMSDDELADIETVARVMTLVNVSVNTMGALHHRLRGQPAGDSRVMDEVLLTTILVAFGLPAVIIVAFGLRRNPVAFIREILAAAGEDRATGSTEAA